jgi:hypothetical protein
MSRFANALPHPRLTPVITMNFVALMPRGWKDSLLHSSAHFSLAMQRSD